jgi:hypothetical protein
VLHEHTAKYSCLEMIVNSNKQTERHLVYISTVGCIKANNITKAFVLFPALPIDPKQAINLIFLTWLN